MPRIVPLTLPKNLTLFLVIACTACQPKPEHEPPEEPEPPQEPHPVLVDGSSTVHPISESVLALYAPRLVTDVRLKASGTGAGFKRFCRGETSINGASRPINGNEMKLCAENALDFIELPVAFDGVAVVVGKQNEFLESTTVEELRKLWEPAAEGAVMRWSDLRSGFPDTPIQLAGPGLESGTFDFFTKAVVGSEHGCRSDYRASENDHELVDFIADNPNALGYFGLAYYARNKQRLRSLGVDDADDENGSGAILPSAQTVTDGSYQPLSRPIFLYVNHEQAQRPEVRDFVEFYLRAARLVAPDVGYVALPKRAFELAQERFRSGRLGSVFDGEPIIGLTIEDLMSAETVEVDDERKAKLVPR